MAISACVRQSPQLPANKSVEVDSTDLILSQSNQKLIESEDSIINLVLKNQFQGKMIQEAGFWYLIESGSDAGKFPQKGDQISVKYEIFDLENNLLLEKSETITIGQQQVKPAVEAVILKLHKGEKSTILLPWYNGYGVKGNGSEIPPYTSVIVKLQYVN